MATFQTTDDANFITEYNNATLLPIMKADSPFTKTIPVDKFALKSGTDVYFRGRLPLAPVAGAALAGTEMTDPTPVIAPGRKIKASLYRIHNSINASSVDRQVSFDGMKQDRDVIAQNIIDSIELHNLKQICPGLLHVRADWDTTSPAQLRFTTTGAGSTTTFTSSTLGQADYYWGGNSAYGYIVPVTLTDTNYGQGRIVSNFLTSGDVGTVSVAWNAASGTGNEFIICVGAGTAPLTTGDKLTVAVIGKAMSLFDSLQIKSNMKFQNASGAGFKIFLSAPDWGDIKVDTDYAKWVQNNAKSPGYEKWSIGNIYTNELLLIDQVYRETTGGVYSATGAVYNVVIMGNGCARRTELNAPRIVVVNSADSGNLAGYKTWITWTTDYAVAPVVCTAGAVVLTVPTTIV